MSIWQIQELLCRFAEGFGIITPANASTRETEMASYLIIKSQGIFQLRSRRHFN